jgi:hypothetical protein
MGKNDALSGAVFQRFCSSQERALRASADVDVTRSDSPICCQEIRVTAEVRPTDAPRGPWDRSATYYGSRTLQSEGPCRQDNCVHKSCVNYGNLRCHFQDRASASIHLCPAVRGHLPGGLWRRYWPDSGDERITGLYWAAVLASKRVRPWVLKFGGRAHRARGPYRQRSPIPQPARGRRRWPFSLPSRAREEARRFQRALTQKGVIIQSRNKPMLASLK